MLAVDTSILVYAHRRESRHGEQAYEVLRALAEGDRTWAIPWPCCYEFLSVVTNRRIWGEAASSPQQAWGQLAAWVASPSNRLIGETDGFVEILAGFVDRPRVVGGIVHDARIAAICVAHGAEALLTRDRDFSMFPKPRTRDPLAT
ncbi:MAG: PIN domain-containing protein [bacterium]|nr:PIN domain-containing protein [bacterium]MDE0353154.1 PIN domain-containing protein [bacterium]